MVKNTKVLISIPMLLTGGTEIQTLHLSKALVSLGFDVTVCCYFEHLDDVVESFQFEGVAVKLLNLNRSITPFKLMGSLVGYVKAGGFDVCHVQYVQPGFLSVLSYKLAKIERVIVTVHQPADYCGFKAKVLFRLSALLANSTCCVSHYVRSSWFGNEADSNKSSVIYNCVSDDFINSQRRYSTSHEVSNEGSGEKTIILSVVGRLRHEKGQGVAIKACSILIKKGYMVQLDIIGDGPDLFTHKKLTSDLSLDKHINFLGMMAQDEILTHLNRVDIAVIPSVFEGFGLVAIEAMAASLPVVASNVGGLMEVVKDGKTGLLFESQNADCLAEKIELLINNAETRVSMGVEGRKRVMDKFTFSKYVSSVNSLYK